MLRSLIFRSLIIAAACAATMAAPAVAGAATCSDSWNADGHSGPWYTAPMTLHGNSLSISCPTQNTAWSVHYLVIKTDGATSGSPIDETRSGHGDTSFSFSTNPVGCNPGWLYETKVHNIITGGNIYKPPGGHVIC